MKAFNIEFYEGTSAQLVADIEKAVSEKFSYLTTTNLDQLVHLRKDPKLQAAFAKAQYRFCSSKALLPFFALCRRNQPRVIPAQQLTETLLARAEQQRFSVSIIGCEPRIVRLLRRRYPRITFHHHYPPMAYLDNPDVVFGCLEFLAQHPSHLYFFALPSPAQQTLALEAAQSLRQSGVGLCVGDALRDFIERSEPVVYEHWSERFNLDGLYVSTARYARLSGDVIRFTPTLVRQLWADRVHRDASARVARPSE